MATTSQQLGLRRARKRAAEMKHSLLPFSPTPGHEVSQYGREFLATCRHCNAYMTVYFPLSIDEAESQGIDRSEIDSVTSQRYGRESNCNMVFGGNWSRSECQ